MTMSKIKKPKLGKIPLQKRTLTELLEEACATIDKLESKLMDDGDYGEYGNMSPELEEWWRKQKELDKKRLQKIREELSRKLTPIEKRALGL